MTTGAQLAVDKVPGLKINVFLRASLMLVMMMMLLLEMMMITVTSHLVHCCAHLSVEKMQQREPMII